MKLRHAVLLALVGFCLVVPPVQKAEDSYVDLMAPFEQWLIEQKYDTEEACFKGRDKMLTLSSKNLDNGKDSPVDRQRVNATCINCDDPRLKHK